ncbi:uncharacterized protein V6R79_007171 [Siganus canaliculatus]
MSRSGLLLAACCLLLGAGFSGAQSSSFLVDTSFSRQRVVTCDGDGHVQRLSCDSGVIRLEAAVYGRSDSQTCSEGRPPQQLSNTRCSQSGTLDLIRTRCDGKKVCEVNTNIVYTSDPCRGTYKYLDTTFSCVHAEHVVVCEHSVATLQCDEGDVITVLGADYGRADTTTCSTQRPAAQVQNTACTRPSSIVAERCNGRTSCSVKASNGVFGDPCVGTYKYLEVAYRCDYPQMTPRAAEEE